LVFLCLLQSGLERDDGSIVSIITTGVCAVGVAHYLVCNVESSGQ
jgi:hypothetical protein